MPSKRERTTEKTSWSEENMKSAINAVKNGERLRVSARRFNVPVTTLHERVKKGHYYKARMGTRTIFTGQQEQDIVQHLLHLDMMFYGLTPVHLRRAVFSYAEKLSITHKFNRDKHEAGKDWMYGFMKRHPELTFKKPEIINCNHVQALNKEEVGKFFKNLTGLMAKYKFLPTHIFNVDETEITTVNRSGKIIGPKSQKEIESATSGDRGKTMTLCCCINATGSFTPPLFIYPRQRMIPALEQNGPPGSIYTCTKSGSMTQEIFLIWLKHFAKINNVKKENPVLLILDNHASHISLSSYEFCKENGIHMLSIPPHSSHRIQPLDLTFFSSLKKAYDNECDLFLKSKPYDKILMSDINGIFTKAYIKVTNPEKAIKGFEMAGIFPIDSNVLGEEDFYENTRHQLAQINDESLEELSISDDCISEPVAGCSKDIEKNISQNINDTNEIENTVVNKNSFNSTVSVPIKAVHSNQQRKIQNQSNDLNNTIANEILENQLVRSNDNLSNLNAIENQNKLVVKEIIVDPHINRLFDYIRYSDEAVSVLPNRSWAIHCTDFPVKRIVVSEVIIHNAHGRGLEPFYVKQIVFDEKLNFELYLMNSRTLLKDKPSCICSMGDFESVLDYVDNIKLCHGGPNISEYSNVNPECAYKDPYNKWRHNLCLLEIHDCDVCESCVSLEEILKRHLQKKSPLKSRSNNFTKRKRMCI